MKLFLTGLLASALLPSLTLASSTGPQPKDWFEKPEVNFQGGYNETRTPVKWPLFSCGKLPKNQKIKDWNELIKARAGLTGTVIYPRNIHIEDLTQFWKIGKEYHQISMIWEQDFPATYRMEHYASEDPSLRKDVKQVEVPTVSKDSVVDAETALSLVQSVVSEARKAGAQEGSRLMQVSTSTADAAGHKTIHHADYLNGQAQKYWDGIVLCSLNDSRKAASCECRKAGDE